MKKTTLNPWTWQEAFGYSQGVAITGPHTTVHVGGQGSVNAAGEVVHAGDMAGQVAQVMTNLEAVLAEADLTLGDVVTYSVHTTDADSYYAASGEVVGRFAAHGNVPVGTILAQVTRLALPPMLVEISAVAVK